MCIRDRAGQNQSAVGVTCRGNLEIHGDRRQETGRPAGGDGLDGGVVAGAAEKPRRIRNSGGCVHDKHNRNQRQEQEVGPVPHVVAEEPVHQQRGRHLGTVLPSRTSTIRSKRASSTTKWLMMRTLRPAVRRSSTSPQNF